MRYDPNSDIDPEAWEELDDSGKAAIVTEYHRKHGFHVPNPTVHAIIHVVVENQIALGDEFPAEAVLQRLMQEGLDRHDAVHAIGSIVADHIFRALREPGSKEDLNTVYVEKLSLLTAESWRKQFPGDEPQDPDR
ncbi:MAG: DUF1841 family protein [Acidobacteria bacterium]|nr:DUF1841 family protein [Acidobacteriota bacterium]